MSCPREGKWFRGCKFEARYDLAAPDFSQFKSIDYATPSMLEKFRKKTYVRDVCVTCGKTIERSQS